MTLSMDSLKITEIKTMWEIKKLDSPEIIVGYFNTPLSVTYKADRKSGGGGTEKLNYNHLHLIDIENTTLQNRNSLFQ